MPIGLEIEVNVPIDQLSAVDIAALAATHALPHPTAHQKLVAQGRRDQNGRVDYGTIIAPANGFRVDADHDDRVHNGGFPLHEGSGDSIIEIVMFPPVVDRPAVDAAFVHIQNYIANINLQTNQLRNHWVGAIAAAGAYPAINMGPLDTSMGSPPRRDPRHGYRGSIQVNIGIDLREYHSLLKWYAKSDYAKPSRAIVGERPIYAQIKADMLSAIAVGKAQTRALFNGLTALQRVQMGNCRGLRGLFTYFALYFIRGAPNMLPGGSAKNLAPALMKSPNTILAQYGLTALEQNHFTANRDAIVRQLLAACNRVVAPLTPLNTVQLFNSQPGQTVDWFTNLATNNVCLTGKPLLLRTGVGPRRNGSLTVQNLPPVAPGAGVYGVTGPNSRGGVVVEFRTLPGYYDGPNSWRAVARDFLAAATRRNQRPGNTTS